MRWTPVVVLMSDDLVAALEDDVHDCETRLNADDELAELWSRNGWDPRMMAYGLVYWEYVQAGVAAGPQATPGQVLAELESLPRERPGAPTGSSFIYVALEDTPPGTRVRVVAVPTDHEDRD